MIVAGRTIRVRPERMMSRGRAVVLLLAIAACGDQSQLAPWRAGHPPPPGVSFDAQAAGLCAVAVRYPDAAPAAIEYRGEIFTQRRRDGPSDPAAGAQVLASGDWQLEPRTAELLLHVPGATFVYRPAGGC